MIGFVIAASLLNPVSLYFLPSRPVEVRLNAELRGKDDARATKLLLLSPTGAIEAEAALADDAGSVDLTKLLPGVWDGKTHYVQATTAKGEGVGSALVVVPLWPVEPNVRQAVVGQTGGKPMALRIYVEQHIVFETTLGKFTISLSPEVAPNTTASFMHLVGGGLYDGAVFHRIVPGFVIQGGDPSGTGYGGPGYAIDLEPSNKKHKRGVLSMARSGDPDSAGSQFFVCLQDGGSVPALDPSPGSPGYTAFGDVVEGMDVVDKIAALPTVGNKPDGRPVDVPMIKDASFTPAPPRRITPTTP